MCEITTALAIAGQTAQFMGEVQETNAQNEARALSRASALGDYNRQLLEEQRNYRSSARATQQKAFDEELKKRAEIGRVRAEAASKGVAGLSVDAVLNEITGIGARTQSRLDDEMAVNVSNYVNATDTAYATTQSRLQSNSPVSGPSLLGLAINVGTALDEGGVFD